MCLRDDAGGVSAGLVDDGGGNRNEPGGETTEFLNELDGEALAELSRRAEFIGEESDNPFPCKLGVSRLEAGIVMIMVLISIRAESLAEGNGNDRPKNFLVLFKSSHD